MRMPGEDWVIPDVWECPDCDRPLGGNPACETCNPDAMKAAEAEYHEWLVDRAA